jgi:para-nitrobenzyl esterase
VEPILETDAGPVRGAREQGLAVFRGVPYAEPPLRELRFAPPRAPRCWDGVRDATRFGPAPPQVADAWSLRLSLLGDLPTDEDCLTLDVFAPDAGGARPILVWIPGGAFVSGTGAAPLYDARRLARRGDAVVVTLNYRVGALGLLFLDGVGGVEAANLGLQDQLAALAWVRAHAARFGGDPGRIAVTWMYLFAWRSPLRGGAFGSCHALDLPFTFGNLDLPGIAEFAGSGPAAERLARDWMDAWIAFARDGDPSHAGIGRWPRYTAESRSTMVFGEKSGAVDAPLEAERAAWDALGQPAA